MVSSCATAGSTTSRGCSSNSESCEASRQSRDARCRVRALNAWRAKARQEPLVWLRRDDAKLGEVAAKPAPIARQKRIPLQRGVGADVEVGQRRGTGPST